MNNPTHSPAETSTTKTLRKNLWFDAARWFATLPIDHALPLLLERLGILHNADRAWIAMISKDHTRSSVTHEWDAPGVSPTLGRQSEQSLEVYRWIRNKLRKGKEVHFDVNDIPKRFERFRQHLVAQGAQSFYGASVFVADIHVGVLGYHKVSSTYKWKLSERLETRKAAALVGEWLQSKARQPAQPQAIGTESGAQNDTILFVKEGSSSVPVLRSNIIYIEASLNYSKIHIIAGKSIIVYRSMEEWEKILPPEQFLRIHRSYIVNIDKITKLDKNGGEWKLLLAGQSILPVGRTYRSNLIHMIKLNETAI